MTDKETGLPLEAPEIDIPDCYIGLWLLYFTISDQVSRVIDGICNRIPPSEFLAWVTITGQQIDKEDYGLLVEMDEAYCVAMNVELREYRERENERNKQK